MDISKLLAKPALGALAIGGLVAIGTVSRTQQAKPNKPNVILILSDDFGYWDAGIYGGGPGRGMPTPNLDRKAQEGMTFFSFYPQPVAPQASRSVQLTYRHQPRQCKASARRLSIFAQGRAPAANAVHSMCRAEGVPQRGSAEVGTPNAA